MGSISLCVMISLFVSGPGPVPAEDAMETANRLLEAGSNTFNAKDGAGMAAQYVNDAEISLLSRQDGQLKSQKYGGKEQIRKLYADLFRDAASIRSRNVVEYARFVGPDLLLIAGTFEPDVGGQLMLQFFQVRVKEADGAWRIRNLQLFAIPHS